MPMSAFASAALQQSRHGDASVRVRRSLFLVHPQALHPQAVVTIRALLAIWSPRLWSFGAAAAAMTPDCVQVLPWVWRHTRAPSSTASWHVNARVIAPCMPLTAAKGCLGCRTQRARTCSGRSPWRARYRLRMQATAAPFDRGFAVSDVVRDQVCTGGGIQTGAHAQQCRSVCAPFFVHSGDTRSAGSDRYDA